MKIYTEIIWSWDDDKGELVQESSKFYDYVLNCGNFQDSNL